MTEQEELIMPRALVEKQKKEIEEKDETIRRQSIQIESMLQALLHAKKQRFGRSSEATPFPGQLSLFETNEELAEALEQAEKKVVVPSYTRTPRKPGVRQEMLEGLPKEIEEYVINEEDSCSECGSPLTVIGKEVVRTEVEFKPARLIVKQIVRQIAKCTKCGTDGSDNPNQHFEKAAIPANVLSHSIATPSLVGHILHQKYVMGVTLNRMEKELYGMGLVASRAQLSHWVIRCCEEWLTPIYDRIHEILMSCEILHMDETRIQVNKEEGRAPSTINGTIYMYKKSKIKMYKCYTVTTEVNSMILKSSIIVDLKINSLEDLYKLKPFTENSSLNINKSQIARELGVDRRTVDKYINGFQKSKKRKKGSRLDKYYDVIQELLSGQNSQVFYYKRILWQYLVDNHGLNDCKYSNFCHYINSHEEFAAYFKQKKPSNADRPVIRFETPAGKQAQLDWKENIPFVLKSGDTITINVLVLLLSYSRFRVYRLSLSRTQDVLLALLNDALETFGGVPQEIVTDNMKTVMDQSRTDASKGKINVRFEQFAKDYGFQIRPCIAGRPQTKAKVEAPMKILDEIRAYSGRLDYTELCELIERINNRINSQVNQGTGRIPLLYFEKEKAFLNPLPTEEIRKHYRIDTYRSRVNPSGMVTYKNSQYSVPPEYIGKEMKLQVYDNYIHIYYNTTLVTLHSLSSKKLNYHEKHYIAIAQQSHSFKKEDIESRAKENLSVIGDVYRYE